MIYITADGTVQSIGFQTENERTQISMPLSEIADIVTAYPDGTYTLVYKRQNDCGFLVHEDFTVNNGNMIITVGAPMLAVKGIVELQATYTSGTKVASTSVYKFRVRRAIINGESAPMTFIDLLSQALVALDTTAKRAEEAQSKAEAAQHGAEAAETNAAESARLAGASEGNAAQSALDAAGSAGAAAASAVEAAGYVLGAKGYKEGAESAEEAAKGYRDESARIADGIATAGAQQVALVEAAGTAQTQAVNSAGTTQVGNVNSAGTTQVGNVNQAGTTQVGLVQAEGTAQKNAVQAKGTEVIESIPQDYSSLVAQVSLQDEEIENIKTNAPQDETGEDLLAELLAETLLTESILTVAGAIIDALPSDETANDIKDALSLTADRLSAIYDIWLAEKEAS